MEIKQWVSLSEDNQFCSSRLVDRFTWGFEEQDTTEAELSTTGRLVVKFADDADVEYEGKLVVYEGLSYSAYLSLRDVALDEDRHEFDTLFRDFFCKHDAWEPNIRDA